MLSVQTNLSVFSGVKYSSSHTTGQGVNKKSISTSVVKSEIFQFSSQIFIDTRQNLSDQNAIFHFNQLNKEDKSSLFYNGTPISELSFDEANELISEDGYFGIAKTSQRIIDFVIKGAGDDIDKLKAGREGVLRGFAAAEKAWGGSLPDICCQTIDQSIKAIDEKIAELGGNIVAITT
ncbi:MAG: hydrogenase-4 component G [Desulfobacteraceae bacterium]|nr:hydrogenase-4 component G [Desulfobacteraceae bacterium]